MYLDLNITNDSLFNEYLSNSSQRPFGEFPGNRLLEKSTRYNLIITFIVLILGLIGNYLIVFVFTQKKNRVNSSHIFLLCLALNDNLFLKVHLFENVLRTYQNFYSISTSNSEFMYSFNQFIRLINIIERNEIACRLVNYLRYVLRLISALIIVAFTLQRLIIVSYPLMTKFKSKNFAWQAVGAIIIVSLVINFWIPFLFEVHTDLENSYCGIKVEWKSEYLTITFVYMAFTMLLPIIIIFTANLITICKTVKSDLHRNNTLQVHKKSKKSLSIIDNPKPEPNKKKSLSSQKLTSAKLSSCNLNIQKKNRIIQKDMPSNVSNISKKSTLKPFYRTSQQLETRALNKLNNSKKITRMLMLISFAYAFLNLPYLVIWLAYYLKITFDYIDPILKNQLFALTRSAETLQILNYGLHFYIYCLSGAMFRRQLQTSIVRKFTGKRRSIAKIEFYEELLKSKNN